jgi:hypothetical protein
MSRVIFDEPAWWQRPGWHIAAAVLALVVLALSWAASSPANREAVALRTPAPPPVATRPAPAPPETIAAAAAPLPAAPGPVAASAAPAVPPLSTMVASGVHITPLSAPPGTIPMPAGPRETDSEPEN